MNEVLVTEWLLKKDNYQPPADKDGFIDRSLLSVLSILSRIRRGGLPGRGLLYRINPTAKFAFSFLLVVFISLSQSFQYVLMADAYVLLFLSLLELKDVQKTITVTLSVGIFSAVILLPSALTGNWKNSEMLFLKIIGSVALINALANSAKWSQITRSLKVFKIPDIFILVLDITIKYIVILGEFSLHMLYALRLRSIGKNSRKHQALSNIMGGLFLKSKEMAELTYAAMECRGFNGQYQSYRKHHFYPADYFYIPVQVILIAAFFLI